MVFHHIKIKRGKTQNTNHAKDRSSKKRMIRPTKLPKGQKVQDVKKEKRRCAVVPRPRGQKAGPGVVKNTSGKHPELGDEEKKI